MQRPTTVTEEVAQRAHRKSTADALALPGQTAVWLAGQQPHQVQLVSVPQL